MILTCLTVYIVVIVAVVTVLGEKVVDDLDKFIMLVSWPIAVAGLIILLPLAVPVILGLCLNKLLKLRRGKT